MKNTCVSCGDVIPEGRQTCPKCDYDINLTVQTFMSTTVGTMEVSFNFGNYPCVSVKDSYKVSKRSDILKCLEKIHSTFEYKRLQQSGYSRTLQSEYREWKAHNLLYRLGICRERTGSVDINQNESKLHRLCYLVLSIF